MKKNSTVKRSNTKRSNTINGRYLQSLIGSTGGALRGMGIDTFKDDRIIRPGVTVFTPEPICIRKDYFD